MTSLEANRPRWRGQPGFFEIWFLVLFDARRRRAWWFRYTTFAPASGTARATVWAAAFDGKRTTAVAGKTLHPIDVYAPGPPDGFRVRIGADAEIAHGRSRGRVDAGGHRIGWDLAFAPAAHAADRGPRWLARLPAPTHVAHASSEILFEGWIEVDGERHAVEAAPGLQKHLWGTRRVRELFWVYCPRFVEDPRAAFEASAVRLEAGRGLRPAPVWMRTATRELRWWRVPGLLRRAVTPGEPGELTVAARSATRRLTAVARCDPATLVGYVYRDPDGTDLHVAQSDVATCAVELRTRPHPLAAWRRPQRFTAPLAAVEFHHPEPLRGVRYVPWDGTSVLDEGP